MKKNITSLKAAIKEKNASQVELCLKTLNASQDFDINMNYGEILCLAVQVGSTSITSIILKHDAEINIYNPVTKKCAFDFAVDNDDRSMASFLLYNHSNALKNRDYYRQCYKESKTNILQLLKEKNAPYEIDGALHPIFHAAYSKKHLLLNFFCENKDNLSKKDNRGRTPLHYAAKNGSNKAIEILLAADSSLQEIADDQGNTARHIAAQNGHLECLQLLTEAVLPNHNGEMPIDLAVLGSHPHIVEYLHDKGETLNKLRLVHCVILNNYDLLQKLYKNKEENIEFTYTPLDEGITLMTSALKNCKNESARFLLDKKLYTTTDCPTAIHIAAENGNTHLVKQLHKAGASLESKDADGNTPLHIAAEKGFATVVNLLISNKVDANQQNKEGNTALHIATEKGHYNIVKTLVEYGAHLKVENNAEKTPRQLTLENSSCWNFLNSAEFLQEERNLRSKYGIKSDLRTKNPYSDEEDIVKEWVSL